MFMFVLKDGRYFTAGNEADDLITAIFELQDRGLIQTSYEILSVTVLET
jgi:hypothetical protein